jgi:hypothetical protein
MALTLDTTNLLTVLSTLLIIAWFLSLIYRIVCLFELALAVETGQVRVVT